MDQAAFDSEFETFRSSLRSFLLRMTANREDADDLVQETYIRARNKLELFKGDSSLKTWVFSIAGNLCRDLLRSKKRWPVNATDISKEAALGNPAFFEESMAIRHGSPQGEFEIKEHISLCLTCVSKSLPLVDHLCLLLKEVYGFTMKESAMILNITDAMVKHHLRTARKRMIDIFDHRCSLINKEGICHQCTELNGIFNPHQIAAEEKAKLDLVKAAGNENKEKLLDLRLKIIEELDPFESAAAELQLHHLEHNRTVIEEYLKKNAADAIKN